jgi:hypothetical protein
MTNEELKLYLMQYHRNRATGLDSDKDIIGVVAAFNEDEATGKFLRAARKMRHFGEGYFTQMSDVSKTIMDPDNKKYSLSVKEEVK